MKAPGADFWSGVALGGLGTCIIVAASQWEYLGQDGPGPGFFPLWYGIAIAALSLALVVSSLRRAESQGIDWPRARRAFAVWAAFAIMVAALKFIGFVIGFAALTFFIVAVMYRRSLVQAAIVGVATAAGFYALFPLALGVPLP